MESVTNTDLFFIGDSEYGKREIAKRRDGSINSGIND